jgi:hypothetical protein
MFKVVDAPTAVGEADRKTRIGVIHDFVDRATARAKLLGQVCHTYGYEWRGMGCCWCYDLHVTSLLKLLKFSFVECMGVTKRKWTATMRASNTMDEGVLLWAVWISHRTLAEQRIQNKWYTFALRLSKLAIALRKFRCQ